MNEEVIIKDKIGLVDIDTFIFQAAISAEENYVRVSHKDIDAIYEYPTKTSFYKCTKKDGESGKLLELREELGLDLKMEDFTIEQCSRLIRAEGDATPLMMAKGRFNDKMRIILEKDWCKGIIICYGRGENFRYNLAQTHPYKNDRQPKPILHAELTKWVLQKYKNKLFMEDGVETDDIIVKHLYQDYSQAKGDVSKMKYVGVFFDKDIPANTPFIMYNPNKDSEGLVVNTPLDAARRLCTQMITGDSVDTIKGLPDITEELRLKYGMRKGKGAGDKAAELLLEGASSINECFSRVVEAYKAFYGSEATLVKGFRGNDLHWTWIDHMNEQYSLLRMRCNSEPVAYISKVLDKLGVAYE